MVWCRAISGDGAAGNSLVGVAFKTRFYDQAGGVVEGGEVERGGAGLGGGHARQIGEVDEAGTHGGVSGGGEVHCDEGGGVADVGAGGLGDMGCDAFGVERGHGGLDRQGGEVGGGGAGEDGFVDRGVAFVVGDAGVDDVEGDAFEADALAVAGEAEADGDIGPVGFERGLQRVVERGEGAGQDERDEGGAGRRRGGEGIDQKC